MKEISLNDFTRKYIKNFSDNLSMEVELKLCLAIRPKPKFLPKIIWHYILKKILVWDYFK